MAMEAATDWRIIDIGDELNRSRSLDGIGVHIQAAINAGHALHLQLPGLRQIDFEDAGDHRKQGAAQDQPPDELPAAHGAGQGAL